MSTLVIIESPYTGDFVRNNTYLHDCVTDCFSRGETPFASHGFYTRYLDENKPEDRKLGIESGYVIMKRADKVVFYCDYGMSSGMVKAKAFATENGVSFETRYLMGGG